MCHKDMKCRRSACLFYRVEDDGLLSGLSLVKCDDVLGRDSALTAKPTGEPERRKQSSPEHVPHFLDYRLPDDHPDLSASRPHRPEARARRLALIPSSLVAFLSTFPRPEG